MKFFKLSQYLPVVITLILLGCSKTPEQHYQQAQDLMSKAAYKAAILELKTVLQTQPNHAEARKLLGQAFIKTRAYSSAEKEFSKARSLGASDEETLPPLILAYTRMGEPQKALSLEIPKSGLSPKALGAAYAARAEAQLATGNLQEAELALEAASQADAKNVGMLLTRAKLAVANKDMPRANQWVDAALQSEPKQTEALFFKAALLESDKKNAEAEKIYQQIIAIDSSLINAYLGLASLQVRRNDLVAADKSVQAAEKLAPKAPLVKYTRGTLELQRGNLNAANSNLLEVLQMVPDHVPSLLAFALVNFSQGNYEQSISNASKVVKLVPGNPVATKILAYSQLKMGDNQAAIKTLETHFLKSADDASLMALAGEAYAASGDNLKAQAYFAKAAQLEPANTQIKTRQAANQLAMGNRGVALAELEAAANLSTKPSEADINLILLHLRGNEFDAALQAVAKLEKKSPNSALVQNFRGAALWGKQDKLGARKAWEQALVFDPKYFPAAANLARMDIQENKPKVAQQRFMKILNIDKNNTAAMVALADLAAIQKNEKDYADWLDKAIQADPKALEASNKLIQYYLRTKQNKKALTLAQNALQANRDNINALNLLGATQLSTGDHSSAVTTFTRVTEMSPHSSDAFLNLAVAQHAAKQASTARNTLNTALRIKPQSIQVRDVLIRMELANKNAAAAMQHARQLQTLYPKLPVGYIREGDIQVFEKRYADAAKAYERALENGGGQAELIKYHRALAATGQAQIAEQRLLAWLKSKPADIGVRSYLAEVYLQTARYPEAIAQYQMLLQVQPNHIVGLNNLAAVYQQEKDSRALATAQKAYALAPEHPGIQDTLGWILVEQGQLAQGISLLNKALRTAPDVALIRYHLGAAWARAGKKAEAKKELDLSIKSGQQFPELSKAQALRNSLE